MLQCVLQRHDVDKSERGSVVYDIRTSGPDDDQPVEVMILARISQSHDVWPLFVGDFPIWWRAKGCARKKMKRFVDFTA